MSLLIFRHHNVDAAQEGVSSEEIQKVAAKFIISRDRSATVQWLSGGCGFKSTGGTTGFAGRLQEHNWLVFGGG